MSILQELLNLGLVDIGSDDSRLTKMDATGTVLVKHLEGNPALVIPATLIAIDRDADADDPILTLVDGQLVKEWKTVRNTHVNRPRELLRSIIIQALSDLGTGNPRMAALIWHTAFSPINHGQARLGKEGELVSRLLQDFQKRAEEEATARARFSDPPLKKDQDRESIQPHTQLQDKDFVSVIGRAAGPADSTGTSFKTPDPNPHWPNEGQAWSYEFTPRMTAVLVKAVNLGMKRVRIPIDKELQSQQKQLERQLTSHSETIRMRGADRLGVLWWSEAKYSPSLRLGYREMQREVAAVAMAHDLSSLVSAMAPASVTYVLGEAVAAISRDGSNEQWSFETLLDALRTSNSNLREAIPDTTTTNGRAPLLELVAKAIGGNRVTREEVRGRTGIDPGLELSLPDFSMWMFRDIQARRLVEVLK